MFQVLFYFCVFRCFGVYWYGANKKHIICIRKYERMREFLRTNPKDEDNIKGLNCYTCRFPKRISKRE